MAKKLERAIAPEAMPDYEEIGRVIGALVVEKQAAYGDAFGQSSKILSVLYPNGIPVEAYTNALTVIQIIDKLFRVANDEDAFGESPFTDIAEYGILGASKKEPK